MKNITTITKKNPYNMMRKKTLCKHIIGKVGLLINMDIHIYIVMSIKVHLSCPKLMII